MGPSANVRSARLAALPGDGSCCSCMDPCMDLGVAVMVMMLAVLLPLFALGPEPCALGLASDHLRLHCLGGNLPSPT